MFVDKLLDIINPHISCRFLRKSQDSPKRISFDIIATINLMVTLLDVIALNCMDDYLKNPEMKCFMGALGAFND